MASIKEMSSGRKDLFLVDPRLINEKDGWNVREESEELKEHIETLSLSIAEIGVQQPLTVYMDDGKLYLSDGHCRLKAVLLAIESGAEIKSVPCRVEDRYANEADRVLSMITRNSGKPLTPLEKSKVIKQLISFGWSEKEISKKVGISLGYVYRLLEAAALPEEIKTAVRQGTVSTSVAVEEVKKNNSDMIIHAAKEGKKITKKNVDRHPERKALTVVYKAAEKYSSSNRIFDLCEELLDLMTDENLLD